MSSIETRAMDWLLGRDTGISSKAIMAVMMGASVRPEDSYPRDPADLGRCLRLLSVVPEWRRRLSEMKACGPVWSSMVDRWDDLEASMSAEVGIDWSKGSRAPKTYDLMKAIRASADVR